MGYRFSRPITIEHQFRIMHTTTSWPNDMYTMDIYISVAVNASLYNSTNKIERILRPVVLYLGNKRLTFIPHLSNLNLIVSLTRKNTRPNRTNAYNGKYVSKFF